MDFVVRNIPATGTGLDGALRIHLAPECMQQAGLTFNEPCQILDEQGKVIGCGIAWRAADKMGASLKTRPARMSETLRDAFGIKEGSHVTLKPSSAKTLHATKLIVTDVTPNERSAGHEDALESRRWRTRCAAALCNAEAVTSGITFDVSAKKGLRKRFLISSLVGENREAGPPSLFHVDDGTIVTLSDGADTVPTSPISITNSHDYELLSTDGIGGLLDQVKALNVSMERVLKQTIHDTQSLTLSQPNHPVLLHGYEGTGKSFILDRLEGCKFRKVLRLDDQVLENGSVSKNKAAISNIFEEAKATQPSLILMDELHLLAPASDDRPYRRLLCRELDKISHSRVLVVGATRSLHDVHGELLGPGRFLKQIELPIPDYKAREQVLNAMLRNDTAQDRTHLPILSSRTHGFTCRDLSTLVGIARLHASERSLDKHEAPSDSEVNGNGTDSHVGDGEPVALPGATHFLEEDWTFALTKVRPAALREIFFETPKIRWSDIGGSQPIRAQLDEIIGWPLKHADLMKLHKLPAQKGMLLYGPPGCSKTLTAQAVAANFEMNFIAIKGAELISMYVGESERSVREIFRKARTAKPCIIFFDEIDSIASERDGAGAKGLNVLTTLLNEMDGFESLDGVFVLAATNKPEVLDPAIMRPGRFDQHLYLPPPNETARRDILELHLSGEAREDDLDIAKLVRATSGYTGAEVVAVCNLAKKGMFRRLLVNQGATVRMDDLESALAEIRPRTSRDILEGYEAFARK